MPKPEKLSKDPEEGGPQFSLLDALPHVWARRKQIAIFVATTTIITVVIVLLQPNMYTAETSILPELEKNKLLGLAGASELAAVTGLNIGEAPVSKLYPMIIKSARILHEVIYTKYKTNAFRDSVNLVDYWEKKSDAEAESFEAALKSLQGSMDVTFDNRLGTLTLKVEAEEPKLAADIANQITTELDLYTRTKRRTSVTAQREFIGQRLVEVNDALKSSEGALKTFREKNRRIIDSPQLLMEQGRLEREVQINSTVFIELKKQIEIAKIEEIKNIPIINVLDQARVPIKKSSPKRATSVAVVFLVAFLLGSGYVAVEPKLRNYLDTLHKSLQAPTPVPRGEKKL